MSKKSGAIILTATATITVFAAAAAVSIGMGRGKDSYSSQILEDAKKRQNYSVAAVPQPLETDLEVLRDEDRMAEKVAVILREDPAFLGTVGDKSAAYVGEKISNLEEIYSSDMIGRIDASLKEAKLYTDDASSSVDFKAKAYADDAASSAVTKAKTYTDSSASSAVAKANSYTDSAVTSNEELVKYLLSNEDFLDALAAAIVARTGKRLAMEEIIAAIVESPEVHGVINGAIEAYHSAHPYVVEGRQTITTAIPLPTFDVQPSEAYSEEEYIETRNAARYTEIDKILDFLGY